MNICVVFIYIGLLIQCILCSKPFILDRFRHLKSKTSPEDQTLAVQKLIARLFASRSNEFNLLVKPGNGVLDTFQYVSDADGRINVQANTGVALAAGVYHFLKYHCNIHVSWSGDQLNLPNPLPKISQSVKINFQGRFRYYQNVCTFSYSFAFWDWARWEKEIDWMALNGINFPLAFTGQEGIWQMVYKELGLTQEELDEHFAGPAYLAWQRMGNLDAWGGPLPVGWYENQLELQKKILNRMRSFGMVPVLPGFAGHVPRSFVKRLYPKANYSECLPWGGFSDPKYRTYLLNPVDPVFKLVGQKFVEKQKEVYNGTDHVYNADVFNEEKPPSYSPDYMHKSSQAIYQAMEAADPDAVWVLQGWTFLQNFWNETLMKAWLSAVPYGKLIVLDLASEIYPIWERTNGYYGYPFIWCMIENFGGNNRMYGIVHPIVDRLLYARSKFPDNLIGTGTTPEGIEQNHLNFEVMNEMAWRSDSFDITAFGVMYAERRYGHANDQIKEAWSLLMKGVYNATATFLNGGGSMGRVTTATPHLVDSLKPTMWYNSTELLQAWSHLIEGAKTIAMTDTLRHDLVQVGAQAIEDMGNVMYKNLVTSFHSKSQTDVQKYTNQILSLLQDLDALYATNKYTLLGNWVESARKMGSSASEKKNLQFNALNQITLWGPSGQISDYANKNWAGLIKSYYHTRWQRFADTLLDSLKTGKKFDDGKFLYDLLVWEEAWGKEEAIFPNQPQGDVLEVADNLYKKYSQMFSENNQQYIEDWEKARIHTEKLRVPENPIEYLRMRRFGYF